MFRRHPLDARGNRTGSTDALGNTTTYTYSVMNRLTQITQPGSLTTTFTYDPRGRRTSVIDANGKATSYGYDDANPPAGGRHLISPTKRRRVSGKQDSSPPY